MLLVMRGARYWAVGAVLLGGCNVLDVSAPSGVIPGGSIQSEAGALSTMDGAKARLFFGIAGPSQLIQWTSVLSDESAWKNTVFAGNRANIDARSTGASFGFASSGDAALGDIIPARNQLLLSAAGLERFASEANRPRIGEANALAGYAELVIAEAYCAGVTLDEALPDGGIRFGPPLTTDSLLATAQAHFEAALEGANGDAATINLASVGLARTLLNRGDAAGAGQAVAAVPTDFTYQVELEPTSIVGGRFPVALYTSMYWTVNQGSCTDLTVADRQGGNGLDFVSAQDPRLAIDSTLGQTCNGLFGGGAPEFWRYPLKFGAPPTGSVPLATGIESRLIEAEAALDAGEVGTWTALLNGLRADAASTQVPGLLPLPDDSTLTADAATRVSVMFRERALWLYGIGTRLGDMRRLIRQYNRDAETVFPTGVYDEGNPGGLPSPLPTYGTDVNLALPTPGSANAPINNPHYQGCLNRDP